MLILAGPQVSEGHRQGGHPERPSRIEAVLKGVEELDLGSDLHVLAATPAPREAVACVHDPRYLDALEQLARRGGGDLDPDTYVTVASFEAALRAAGAGLDAVAELARLGGGVALVAVRPPGHHATATAGMGFCLVNNVAVTAMALAQGGERVAIVDWDVHHGNGTQDLFYDDPRVLYASLHQSPLYPGTGAVEETGGPKAPGTTVNVPLPAGATGDVARRAIEEVVGPAVERFSPTWLLVSAGFDAHRDDPLASLGLSAGDFADLAASVAELTPAPGRLALFLEGGYDLAALTASVRATLGRLLGLSDSKEAPTAGGPGQEAVRRASLVQQRLA